MKVNLNKIISMFTRSHLEGVINNDNVVYRFFISDELLPRGFIYPSSYRNFVSGTLPDLDPWMYFCIGRSKRVKGKDLLQLQFEGLQKRYPKRKLVPFSRRVDCDDVACFDASKPSDDPPVIFIHDFASPGWEHHGGCENFLAWLEIAKQEAAAWEHYQKYGD